MSNEPINSLLALRGRDLLSWVDLIARICNHGSRICNLLNPRRCNRLGFMFVLRFNERLDAKGLFQLCNVARQLEDTRAYSLWRKSSVASFVMPRLATLPCIEVELTTESFISWRCPRSVLSCVGAFIYRAGSLFLVWENTVGQRQPLTF